METEKGVYIIVYKVRNAPRYLVLKRKKNWEGWETPKGHLEEDYIQTVRRELEEESGIEEDQIKDIEDMDEKVEWEYQDDGEDFRKEYRAFLVRVSEDAHVDVTGNPDDEHEKGFFFSSRDAKRLITYDDNLEILEKAEKMIHE